MKRVVVASVMLLQIYNSSATSTVMAAVRFDGLMWYLSRESGYAGIQTFRYSGFRIKACPEQSRAGAE